MTHHKYSGPVEPYTAHMAEGMAQAIDSGLPVNSPALAATLRAYAAQGKRVEALSDALAHRTDERDYQQARAEKAEAALGEAVGLLRETTNCLLDVASEKGGWDWEAVASDARAFLAKQASK